MNGMRYDGEHATRRRLMTRKNGSFSSSSILLCFLLFSPAAQNEIPDSGRSRDRLRRHTHGPNVSQKKRDECVPATPLQVFIIETYICERPSIRLKLIFFVGVRESADLQAPVTSGRRGSGKWATSLAFCVWPLSICHFVRPPEAPLVHIHFFFPKIFGHDAVDGLFVSACGCSQKRTDAVRKAVRTFRLVWAESERLDIFWFLASQERPFVSRWAAT